MTSRIASLLLMLALTGAASGESLRGSVRQLSQAWDRDLEETSLQLPQAWDRELEESETDGPTTGMESSAPSPIVEPLITDSPTESPFVSTDAPETDAPSEDKVVDDVTSVAPSVSPVVTEAPTEAPIETSAPTETEEVPVATPVAAPVATPVAAPVATPVAAPVAAPVATPVASPVADPVADLPAGIDSEEYAEDIVDNPTFVVKSSMEFKFFDGQERNPTNAEIEVFTKNAKALYTKQLKECYGSKFEKDQDVDATVEYDEATHTLTIHFKINVLLSDAEGLTEHLVAQCISEADWHNYIKKLQAKGSWGINEVTYTATGKGRRLL